jgi:hypothetical protein
MAWLNQFRNFADWSLRADLDLICDSRAAHWFSQGHFDSLAQSLTCPDDAVHLVPLLQRPRQAFGDLARL